MDLVFADDAYEGIVGLSNNSSARPLLDPDPWEYPNKAIKRYLLERVPEFAALLDIRKQCGKSPRAKEYFQNQRRRADTANHKRQKFFFFMMMRIAEEVDKATQAFSNLTTESKAAKKRGARILDMCTAPGGFLAFALRGNPRGRALAFTLPVEEGGHKVLLQGEALAKVDLREMDITMLTADMGIPEANIPADHEDHESFLPRQIEPDRQFDLVICDGHVLRTHPRAEYRKNRELYRLRAVQLALGLKHLRPGGTMIVLLHKLEDWKTVTLIHTFSLFSGIQLYKPDTAHRMQSSFYLVAKKVQSRQKEASAAVERWTAMWEAGTFSATDGEYRAAVRAMEPAVEDVLAGFGEQLVLLGRSIWANQAEALADAPFKYDSLGEELAAELAEELADEEANRLETFELERLRLV